MPVVATMTLMALRERSQANFPQPFTDPRELRDRLERALVDAPETTQEQAYAIAETIEESLRTQREIGEASLARYIDNMETRYWRAEELEDVLAPLDRARRESLYGIVEQREELRSILTEEQWKATFGS